MQAKLDPTLKRIGGKLRDRAARIVADPLPARMTELLAQLSHPEALRALEMAPAPGSTAPPARQTAVKR